MTDFTNVSNALSALQSAVGALSTAIESQVAADAALVSAQGIAASAAQSVIDADAVADQALNALVVALSAVGVTTSS
jgi:hypothetical protein